MGVIHKFKSEVVDFLIQRKSSDPSLSCRKLAVLIFEQFQIKVSKSAINNILSQASLNSFSKRRPSCGLSPKKFSIPESKKKQLLEGFKALKAPLQVQEKGDSPEKGEPRPSSSSIPIMDPFSEKPEVPPKAALIKGMGRVFLKGAAWDVLMGDYLDLLDVAEGMGINGADDPQKFMVQYFEDKAQAFLRVSHLEVILEDETRWFLDGRGVTLWEHQPPAIVSCPLRNMTRWLSKCLVSNNQPVLFNTISEKRLPEVLAVFEGVSGKKIEKIKVFSGKEKMADLKIIPSKKREFATGIWKDQKEFSEWTNNVHSEIRMDYFHPILKKDFGYCEGEEDIEGFGGRKLRVFVLWEKEKRVSLRKNIQADTAISNVESPFLVILTNQINKASEDIIYKYLLRWPNLEMSRVLRASQQSERSEDNLSDAQKQTVLALEGLPMDFKGALHAHCQRHFYQEDFEGFSLEQASAVIYDLPGYLEESEEYYCVTLSPSNTYPHRALLEQAASQVNERNVVDDQGRQVRIIVHSDIL